MSVLHIKSLTIADGTNTDIVRPSDWLSAHNQQITLAGNTAGQSTISGTNIAFQGGNNVTLSAVTAAGAATIIVSGANTVAQTVQTQASGAIAGTGFTSTTTAGSNITAAMGTNGLSMAVPVFLTGFTQSTQTQAAGNIAGTGYTSTTTAGTAVTAALGTNGLSMAVPAFITTYVNDLTSGRAGTGFTSTTTAGTAVTAALGTNGLSMAVPQYITTYVNDLTSGRAGTGFTSTTTAGTAITAALGTNGLSMAVPAYITTFAAQTTQTQPAGNIAGVGTTLALTNITGTLNVGTNGVALSLSGNAAGGGGGAALQGSGTYTQNTGTIQFANSNGVTFGLTSNQMTASVNTVYAGTGYISTTQAGSTVGITQNSNGLSAAWPPFITTATQSTQTQASGAIAGTGFTSTTTAGTAITAALGTNGLNMAVPAYITTFAAQTTQTQPAGNIAGAGYTSTTQAGTTVGVTQNSNGLSAAWPPFITTFVNDLTSGRAGTGFTSTTTAGTAITAALGTNGLSMAVPQYITTYVNDLTSGRAGTGTTLALTNINGTMSVDTNGVALSLNNIDAHFTGWALAGNTSGTSSTGLTTIAPLYLQGGNNITLSGNSNTIVISGAAGGTVNQTGPNIGVSNLGNTAGTTGTVSTGNVVFAGSNGIVLSQSIGAGSTGATISIAEQPLFAWANQLYQPNSAGVQFRQNTSAVFPAFINNAVTFDHIRCELTVGLNSTTVATTANTTFSLGAFYTFNVGFFTTNTANATSLGSVLSTSAGLTHQISVQAGTAGSQYTITNAFTYPVNAAGGTSSFSTSYNVSTSNLAFSTTQLTQFTGAKHFEISMASSLPANMYWVALGVSSTTSTQGVAGITNQFITHSHVVMTQPNNTWGFFGQANNATVQAISGVGSLTSNAALTGFGFSNISSTASHIIPYIYMEYDG